ncbi:isocitrate/isopropylmalate dehydrogenase family protein [Geopsychrobacter electrodiphilus]|uniref:isocitrate/isopropylmalate dehydrogenase family protein n=1 Tax=Geopsychrobacter electrodiphilus TaxID=225196 RepID=UPI000370B6DF|nr:isocitrate/isopropylmalate family dehydrogenase [Geopsychrobacter electrodiphilus]
MSNGKNWQIVVIPGDGIGHEVMVATLAVLDVLRADKILDLTWKELPWPSTAWHRQYGEMMPADGLQQLRQYDAILLGALGDPGPKSDPNRYVVTDGISLAPLLEIRKGFDLWACERPARLLEGARQYLADPRAREVDMLVIRENSEGEYVNQGGRLHCGTPFEIATQVEVFSRHATERLIRHAFHRAQQRLEERRLGQRAMRQFSDDRGGQSQAQVCLVTKRNALPHWGELYCEVFAEIAPEFPEIGLHHELVDAACMKFVQCPWQFDVVVASNLQGDILTDLAAVLSGGMGVASSCNINPDDHSMPAMFEPTHGSAPDIAGEDKADPRAMILTAANMLDWMGTEDRAAAAAAQQLRQAVAQDLAANHESERSTSETGRAIMKILQSS